METVSLCLGKEVGGAFGDGTKTMQCLPSSGSLPTHMITHDLFPSLSQFIRDLFPASYTMDRIVDSAAVVGSLLGEWVLYKMLPCLLYNDDGQH